MKPLLFLLGVAVGYLLAQKAEPKPGARLWWKENGEWRSEPIWS